MTSCRSCGVRIIVAKMGSRMVPLDAEPHTSGYHLAHQGPGELPRVDGGYVGNERGRNDEPDYESPLYRLHQCPPKRRAKAEAVRA